VTALLRLGFAAALLLLAPEGLAAFPQATAGSDARPIEPQAGRLANGLRYIVVPRRSRAFEDAARVSFRMHVEGGWLAEKSGERGLAHLIEHMTTDANGELTPAEVVKLRDELTIATEWGAWTSPEGTEYFLSSRSNDVATLDRLMLYLHGIYRGMKFERAAVDRQRQVVANEMALGRARNLRLYERARILAPGSALDLAEAYVSTDVATAGLETIERVYRRIYRPEHVTLIIVGDVDPDEIDPLIRKHFGASPSGSGGTLVSPTGRVPELIESRRAAVSFEPAPGGPPAVLLSSAARLAPADLAEGRRAERRIADRLISTALNQRLEIRAIEEGLARASFSIEEAYPTLRTMQWEAVPDGKDWEPALRFLLRQLALADAAGFSDREVAIAKKRLLRQLADERDWAVYAPNAKIAERILADMLKGLDPVSAELAYRRDSEAVAKVDAAQINLAWRASRRAAPLQVRVESEGLARLGDPASRILQAVDDQKKRDSRPGGIPAPKLADRLAYSSERPGAIRSDAQLPEGVRRVTFANGVVLNLIRRPHEGKWLEIALDLDAPLDRLRLTHCDALALPLFVEAGGSVRQSASQMREAVMDADLRLAPFYASATGLAAGASVRKEDIGSAIPFLYALVADPGFRPGGTKAARAQVRGALNRRLDDPVWALLGAVEEKLAALRSGRDVRFDGQCADRSSMARARRLIGPILSKGRIELAVAGNFDESRMIALVASTFGSVTAQQAAPGAAGRTAVPSVQIDVPRLAAAQAVQGAMWELGPAGTARERAVQEIFATAFARALYTRLVERNGLSYSPRAQRMELSEWFGRPVLFAASAVPADRLEPVAAAIGQVVEGMIEAPLDTALLELARGLALGGLRASYNEDRVWAYQAVQLGRQPDAVRAWRQTESALGAVTADEIRAFAKKTFARQLLTIDRRP
jgi:zinc protease